MGLLSFPSSIQSIAFNSLPLTSHSRNLQNPHASQKISYVSSNLQQSPCFSISSIQTNDPLRRTRGLSVVPFNNKSSGSGEEDDRALETVLNLYSAIKSQNVRYLSSIIADECQCVCNFLSFFQPLQGKKQVLEFFISLIRNLGDNIEFVVHPTMHDGMNIGVQWTLEWNKPHVPLGRGFSFHVCQSYKGKVMIRNVEMFMEPLLHIEPLRLKIIGFVMTILNKTSLSRTRIKKVLYIFLALLLLGTIMLFSKPGLY